HGIKAGAIDVPATAVGIEKEIAVARGGRLPRRADTVGFQSLAGGEKSVPDTQLGQRPSQLWWQRLANARSVVGRLLDQGNAEPAAAEIECGGRAGWSGAGHQHVKGKAHVGKAIACVRFQ